MRSLRTIALFLLLITAVSTYGYCLKQVDFQPSEEWSGAYLGTRKIGYEHAVTSKTTFEKQEVYCIVDTSYAELGAGIRSESTSTLYADSKFNPIYLKSSEITLVMGSRSERTVEARFNASTIECKTTIDGKTTTKSVSVPAGVDLTTICKTELGVLRFEIGDKLDTWTFDSDKLAITHQTCKVTSKAAVEVHKKTYNTLVVALHDDDMDTDSTNWCLEDGTTVRTEIPLVHLTMLLESKEEAMKLDATDLPLSNGRIAAKPVIPENLFIRSLKVRLNGLCDGSLAISDGTQTALLLRDKNAIEYSVSAKEFDSEKAAKLPIKDEKLKNWLKDSKGVEVSDKSIQKLAREIIGNEKNAYTAAMKLMKWVYENIEPHMGAGTTISAVEILKTKSGDCKHYSMLYAALARAAGIPTKLITGLAYSDGSFFGHAWAESYVGEWIPVDPAFTSETVDATHIRLTKGLETIDGKECAEAASGLLMGTDLKAEILGYTILKADAEGNITTETFPGSTD